MSAENNSLFIPIKKYKVSIEYCTKCKWMMRAAWMAQELLSTLGENIREMSLIPGEPASFLIKVDEVVIFDRKVEKRFPEMKELKQLVRNIVAPQLNLGHSDTPVQSKVAKETENKYTNQILPLTSCPDC